jgi:hypothetical protein
MGRQAFMRRPAAALALVLALGGTAGCAELTTTGVPADGASEVSVESMEQPGAEAPGSEAQVEDPTAAMEQTEQFAETVVGMSDSEAQAATEAAGYAYRVVMVDGEPLAVTMDYRPDRVNVALEDDVVTAATVG